MARVVIENDQIVGWSNDPKIGVPVPAEVQEEGRHCYHIKKGKFVRKPQKEIDADIAEKQALTKEKQDKNTELYATARDKKETAKNRIDALVALLIGE